MHSFDGSSLSRQNPTRRGSRSLTFGNTTNGSEPLVYLTVNIIFNAFKRRAAEIRRAVAVPPFRWQEVVKIMTRPPVIRYCVISPGRWLR
jgi:hypothetical protein